MKLFTPVRLLGALAIASLAPAMPVAAQPAAFDPATMVGQAVLDPAGKPVGQVTGQRDGLLFIKTDRHETSLPISSFTYQQKKLYIAFTQAELNAEVDKTVALINASLTPGAAVKGIGGNVIGKIHSLDAQYVAIDLTSGQTIRVPRNSIAGTAQGAVIGMTKEQLEAALSNPKPPAPSSN
ncbi:preprotein translocase subunit YajC [Sphingomonas sp. HDW15A]|uniref:preprotein translocase subunit YajC n=1 Tax=Sphingomonas sp. HDW15A TaxID=2714942 RepID=UPI00140B016F|nr:preprotein translocase subunit YajC [Sphingomonas sp. HDW15A]QIK95743.1 preprotein translocase subunit YajC [Sphingomonas sp. HDW15A]